MEKNFQIGQSNELIKNDIVYDLHNHYDFASLTIDCNRTMRLSFVAISEFGEENIIILEFKNLDYLGFSSNFGASKIKNLDEIGYKSPDDLDDQWLLSEQQASSIDHLFFRFEEEHFVRVHCKMAHFRKENAMPLVK